MSEHDHSRRAEDQGVDVTADSPLPDIPQASADSQPISPPEPIDISTATLNTNAVRVAGTFGDGDDRTLYEQALDDVPPGPDLSRTQASADQTAPQTSRVRIYDR